MKLTRNLISLAESISIGLYRFVTTTERHRSAATDKSFKFTENRINFSFKFDLTKRIWFRWYKRLAHPLKRYKCGEFICWNIQRVVLTKNEMFSIKYNSLPATLKTYIYIHGDRFQFIEFLNFEISNFDVALPTSSADFVSSESKNIVTSRDIYIHVSI